MNARFFGETPVTSYNGAKTVDVSLKKGNFAIQAITDTVITSCAFAHPTSGATALPSSTLPAGNILYGLKTAVIASGTGVCYHSNSPDLPIPTA